MLEGELICFYLNLNYTTLNLFSHCHFFFNCNECLWPFMFFFVYYYMHISNKEGKNLNVQIFLVLFLHLLVLWVYYCIDLNVQHSDNKIPFRRCTFHPIAFYAHNVMTINQINHTAFYAHNVMSIDQHQEP